MEDSSSKAGSEDPRHRDSDRSTDLTDRWQSDLKLGDCMLQLFDEGLWTDISFRCSDQTEENPRDGIHAHKIVLAARSPVFQAMFFGPCKESNTVIEVQDAESQYFELFLRLLYSDQYTIVEEYDDLVNVLDIAHKYQVTYIVDRCCKELAELLDEENACSILERALLFDNKYLIELTSDFIDENADGVLYSDGFLDTSVACLTYILKGDTFYADESEIFERAIEWAEQECKSVDGQDLRKTLGEAFFYLRTPVMSLNDFVECTHRKGYYTAEEYEDIMAVMGMSEKTKPKCNSTQKRFPLRIELSRLSILNKDYDPEEAFVTNETITETISISSLTDTYLTRVTFVGRTFIFFHKELFEGHFTKYSLSNGFTVKEMPVSVSLKFGDTPTIIREVPAGPTTPCITLTEPFFLSAGQSVNLQIDMTLKKIPGFQLRTNKCVKPNELTSEVTDTVDVKTQKNALRVVHSLHFKCVNNRD